MLIEMVSFTLAVVSGISPFSGVVFPNHVSSTQNDILTRDFHFSESTHNTRLIISSPEELQAGLHLEESPSSTDIVSPIPTDALESDVPEEEIVAMLAEPTPTPTSTPTPTPTTAPTATPTPTNTPTPTETPTQTPPPAVAAPVDLESLFTRFSGEYSVDREQLKRIASCESKFNNDATNGDYVGMFQFATASWSAVRGRMGADPNPDLRRNPEEAIKTAAFHISRGGQNAWPSCK